MIYDLTYPGVQYREELVEEVTEATTPLHPSATMRQLDNMRRLWVLDQYRKVPSGPMTGPVMAPVFQQLVQEGYIGEKE